MRPTKSKRLFWTGIACATGGFLLVACGAAWMVFGSFHSAIKDVTDPSCYGQVLADLGYPTPVKLDVPTLGHFPPTVPADASRVRFYYRPHFMQGGTQIQLRMVLPPAELRKVIATNQPAARDVQQGGDLYDGFNGKARLPSAAFRDATNTGFAPLPADFRVFVLNAKVTGADSGWSYGVAVSQQRGEVIYWAEDW